MKTRTHSWKLVTITTVLLGLALWLGAKFLIEWFYPLHPGLAEATAVTWAERGQFGDMFGAVTCLFSALTLVFIIYSNYQEARALEQQNDNDKWAVNYQYLLEAKKLVATNPEIFVLHGLPKDIHTQIGATLAQVAYVLIDVKGADLFYKMSVDKTIRPTAYREHLLSQPLYREIVRRIILPGKFLGVTDFSRFLAEAVESPDYDPALAGQVARNLGARRK